MNAATGALWGNMLDAHAHIGAHGQWQCDIARLTRLMDAHGVSQAIVSSLAGNDVQTAGEELAINRDALALVAPYGDRFRVLYFAHPACAPARADIAALAAAGGGRFVGLKVHPTAAGVPLCDARFDRCFALAQALGWPVCAHTQDDGFSDVRFAMDRARRHPSVRVVAVHAGWRTDHTLAYVAAAALPNFFVDTALMHAREAADALAVCPQDKLLFGSDADCLGEDSYARYAGLADIIARERGLCAARKVCHGNAARLFALAEAAARSEK